jgi:hypothetical protein
MLYLKVRNVSRVTAMFGHTPAETCVVAPYCLQFIVSKELLPTRPLTDCLISINYHRLIQ